MTLRFELVSGRAEIEKLRRPWNEWARSHGVSPFAYPGFFDAWNTAFGATHRGVVVTASRGRELQFILPLWHSETTTAQWSSLGAFRADYTEAITRSREPALAIEFWNWLERNAPCTSAKLARMPADSLLGSAALSLLGNRNRRLLRAATTLAASRQFRYLTSDRLNEHPYADRRCIEELSDRIDAKYMRRNAKMLLKHGSALTYDVVKGSTDIGKLLPAFFAMHVANFAGTGRASQFELDADRAFYESLVAHPDLGDVLCMDILRLDDRPVAMHLGFQDRAWIYYYKPTFDLELGKASPGKIMLAHLFKRAHEQNVQRIDLLKGNEGYKDDWSNLNRDTVTTSLVRRGLRELVGRVVSRRLGTSA